MGDAGAAGGRGGARRRLGLDLQPLVAQSFGEVVVHRHTDGELLGAGPLVVHAQAALEVLVHHVLVVAFGNH